SKNSSSLYSIFDSPMDIDDWIYIDDESLTNSEVDEFSNSSEINEFSNSSGIDEIFNSSKIDEFSSSSDSPITVNHAGSNQLSDEIACALRLFEVKSHCNLIDDAFRQTMLAVNNEAYTQPVRIEKDKEKFSASYDVRGRTLKNKIRTVTDKKWAVYWI
ncbi:17728_t:CDS:2, partial [Funneliformis geosporum]